MAEERAKYGYCPKCGEILEFDLGGDETDQNAPEEHTEEPRA